jgi:hypothetical protein
MTQLQPTFTQQTAPSGALLDPTPIIKSESPAAVILAIAILMSMLISGITGLVRVLMMSRSFR